jgi:hypothetical protein
LQYSPDFKDVREAFAGELESFRGFIDARLARITNGPKLGAVLPYYETNLDQGLFPLLMLEQDDEDLQWETLDTGSGPNCKHAFAMTIWGAAHGYPNKELDDIAALMAGGVRDALNRRHFSFRVGAFAFYFDETIPAASIRYGTTAFGKVVVRGFNVRVTVHSLYSIPQDPGSIP